MPTQAEKKKIEKVIKEFKAGKLKTSAGKRVATKAQAVAIALAQVRREKP